MADRFFDIGDLVNDVANLDARISALEQEVRQLKQAVAAEDKNKKAQRRQS